MSESQYVINIIKKINDLGGKAVKFVETEFSEKGTPDIIGCFNGQMFLIETKIYPNEPSDIQYKRMEEWTKAGAIAVASTYPHRSAKDIAFVIMEASNSRN